MSKVNKVPLEHVRKMQESLTVQTARIGETTTTVAEALLPNGFSVGSGKSACVDPSEYNAAKGESYAKERALSDGYENIWNIEGYLLKVTGKLSTDFPSENSTPLERVKIEHADLSEKLVKLRDFLKLCDKDILTIPKGIDTKHLNLLESQLNIMYEYRRILEQRMALMS